MKKLLLASVALVAATATSLAADLPRRMAAPAPAVSPVMAMPMFTWTGFYAGLHAGYVWSDTSARAGTEGGVVTGFTAGGVIPDHSNFGTDGGMFGAQAGFNAQFGSIVAGIEGDLSWTDFGGSGAFTRNLGGGTGITTTLRNDVDWLGTLRGRVGVAFDRALIYATGGFAFGDTNYRGEIATFGFPSNGRLNGSNDDLQTGYAIGAGVEYALTNNLTLKGEWLYYDLGRETVRVSGTANATANDFVDYRFDNDGNIGRVGLNVKF